MFAFMTTVPWPFWVGALAATMIVSFFVTRTKAIGSWHKALIIGSFVATAVLGLSTFQAPAVSTTVLAPNIERRTIVGLLDDSGSMSRCMPFSDEIVPQGPCDGFTWADVMRNEFINLASLRMFDQVTLTLLSEQPLVITKPQREVRLGVTMHPITMQTVLFGRTAKLRFEGTELTAGLKEVIEQLENSAARGRVLAIMSDGEDEIPAADKTAFIDKLKALQVSVYWVKTEDLGSSDSGRLSMTTLLRETNGKTIVVHNKGEAEAAFATINLHEQPEAVMTPVTSHPNLTPLFVIATLLSLLLFVLSLLALPFRTQNAA